MARRLLLLLAILVVSGIAAPRSAPVIPAGTLSSMGSGGISPSTDQGLSGAPLAPVAVGEAGTSSGDYPPTPVTAAPPTAMTIAPAVAHNPHPPSAELSTVATWYRWRPNEAAAGPGLRAFLGAHWRGTVVEVCRAVDAPEVCVWVRLSDWCLCNGGHGIDLDSRSFSVLAPLSRGVLSVTVRRIEP